MLPEFPELEKIAEPPRPLPEQAAAWWWWAGAIGLGILALGLLLWGIVILVRRSRLPGVPLRPETAFLSGIAQLRKQAGELDPAAFGTALSGLVRSFLHRRAGMLARFATTEEITGKSRAGHQAPPPPLAAAFAPILESCDAMKFGSAVKARAGYEELLSRAESVVLAVNETLKHRDAPAVKAPALPDLPHAPAS